MTTEKIIVKREVDGERCGEGHKVYPEIGSVYCELFGEQLNLSEESNYSSFGRCPQCLSTPPAEVLTEEQREVLQATLERLLARGHNFGARQLCAAFPWLEKE